MALGTSLGLHRAIGSYDAVARYVAVSDFVKRKHVQAGFEADRIAVRRNFAWPAPGRVGPGRYHLYVGRLSPEKGVDRLVREWRPSDGHLVVVGDGPLLGDLAQLARPGVDIVGGVPAIEVNSYLSEARSVIVPSVWYEGMPRVVVEAFSVGVPVIASDIGGLGEVVRHDICGLLVEPKDGIGLRAAVDRLNDDRESLRLGAAAHREWRDKYSPEMSVGVLEQVYAAAAGSRGCLAGVR
jgi:glycosyltransferase involved in cell wall biosynthesis